MDGRKYETRGIKGYELAFKLFANYAWALHDECKAGDAYADDCFHALMGALGACEGIAEREAGERE